MKITEEENDKIQPKERELQRIKKMIQESDKKLADANHMENCSEDKFRNLQQVNIELMTEKAILKKKFEDQNIELKAAEQECDSMEEKIEEL